jgi:hypothetical protein
MIYHTQLLFALTLLMAAHIIIILSIFFILKPLSNSSDDKVCGLQESSTTRALPFGGHTIDAPTAMPEPALTVAAVAVSALSLTRLGLLSQ